MSSKRRCAEVGGIHVVECCRWTCRLQFLMCKSFAKNATSPRGLVSALPMTERNIESAKNAVPILAKSVPQRRSPWRCDDCLCYKRKGICFFDAEYTEFRRITRNLYFRIVRRNSVCSASRNKKPLSLQTRYNKKRAVHGENSIVAFTGKWSVGKRPYAFRVRMISACVVLHSGVTKM